MHYGDTHPHPFKLSSDGDNKQAKKAVNCLNGKSKHKCSTAKLVHISCGCVGRGVRERATERPATDSHERRWIDERQKAPPHHIHKQCIRMRYTERSLLVLTHTKCAYNKMYACEKRKKTAKKVCEKWNSNERDELMTDDIVGDLFFVVLRMVMLDRAS